MLTAKSSDFARPILNHIRKLVHAACPDVEETLKWSLPHFVHKGILSSMASFKNHCAFGFWKARLIIGEGQGAGNKEGDAMGQFGRITALSDLPDEKVLIGYIKAAVRLNDARTKVPVAAGPFAGAIQHAARPGYSSGRIRMLPSLPIRPMTYRTVFT